MTTQRLITQLLIDLLFDDLQVQVSHLVIGGSRASGVSVYHPAQGESQPWNVSGGTLKFNEISINLQYPKNHQSGLPRPPKVVKMRSKWRPKIINFEKTWKSEI